MVCLMRISSYWPDMPKLPMLCLFMLCAWEYDVPSTKQIEIREERDLGPRPVEEIDIVSPVMSKQAMASKPEELPQKTVDDTAAKQTSISHLVKTGDTLTSIARKYKTSVDAIISENNLPNYTINIGQTLKISISDGVASDRKGG